MATTCTTHVTTISSKGLAIIKEAEGLRLKPYICPAGYATVGYGSTYYENGTRVKIGDPAITAARAESLLRVTVAGFEKGVDTMTRDDISQGQFDALVSFAFNVGLGQAGFGGSTLLKKVNKNPNDITIAAEFARWNKGGGKVLPGLIARRKKEADLYFS